MSPTRKTCGPLYKEAFLKYAGGDPDKERNTKRPTSASG